VTLKLKTADFHARTRSRRFADPTRRAEAPFRNAATLFASEADGPIRFPLIGSEPAPSSMVPGRPCDRDLDRPQRLEQAIDQIRGRHGEWFGSARPRVAT
jgi:DNA polymerase-4